MESLLQTATSRSATSDDKTASKPETPEDRFIATFVDFEEERSFRFDSRNPSNIRYSRQYRKASVQQENSSSDQAYASHDGLLNIINYRRINDIRFINKYFEEANKHLQTGGVLVGCVETKDERKKRVLNKAPLIVSYPFYTVDFVYKRVLPKIPGIKRAYFAITKGYNRVLTLPETLGRLYSCGFRIVETKEIGYRTWFIARKVGAPEYNMSPTYGPLVTLNRVAKDHKIIKVYKMRTMYPYSEYIQEYLYDKNGTADGDKIIDDFRVTSWGKIMRALWLDELPMLYNWLKRDLKIVGVRPLSRHKFNTYPAYLQQKRTKFKAGLVPPFYADMPETQEDFYKSESDYLDAYEKAPLRTDIRYFFKAMYNIFVKRARSE